MLVKYSKKIDDLLAKIIKLCLVSFTLALLILSTSSIFLRWFDITFLWMEPLVRHIVFLLAFLGAIIATGDKSHIGIDILGNYFRNKKKVKLDLYIKVCVNVIACATCIVLTYAGYSFFKMESLYAKEIFFHIKSNLLVFIIPFGFAVMAVRFLFVSIFLFDSLKNQN